MNIFEKDSDFVELDNRKNRTHNICSAESLYNKFMVQLPKELIQDKTVLDLGSCLGAAGHWALTNNAAHYTGVEIQDYYVNTSNRLLSQHWSETQFTIVKQNIEEFLDQAIANKITYDYVLAAGVLYGFIDVVSILKKISLISNKFIVIDTLNIATPVQSNLGIIIIKKNNMIRAVEENTDDLFHGYGSLIGLEALDIILSTNSFYRTEPILLPTKLAKDIDPYHDNIKFPNGEYKPTRYIVRYIKKETSVKTLTDLVVNNDNSLVVTFSELLTASKSRMMWQFDKEVASRFQHEAESHIPDYRHVINLSINFAKKYIKKSDPIIDVGSALGYTLYEFERAGFNNVIGVESSTDMIEQSLCCDKIINSDTLPINNYQLVTMNWTLHFIKDKIKYLKDIHQNLNTNGMLILTDKTMQSELVKDMYYQFKLDNGVSLDYIKAKEEQLKNIMFVESLDWYITNLNTIFSKVEIINSRLGFTTFLCFK